MRRISAVIQQILQGNPFIQFGFYHRLFNLTQLALYLQPLIEARTQKAVQVSAITMNLSRLQRRLTTDSPIVNSFHIDHLTIHSGLCTLTYHKNSDTYRKINELYKRIQKENGYSSIAQGMREITVIIESAFLPLLQEMIKQAPVYQHMHLASVGVQFDRRYAKIPGLLYTLLQRVTLQNINLIEISSTYTEIVFYVDEKDTRTVFDTLFQSFLANSADTL
jgi:aspartokinase